MKQQLNFYTDTFKPVKDFLSLDNMIVIWVAGFILSIVLYVYEFDQLNRIESQRNLAQQQQDRIQSQLGSLQSSFSRRGDITALNERLEDRRGHYNTLEAVLRQLDSRSDGMRAGVAGIMENLTELDLNGIWLTEISVYQGQLSVVGETRDPKQIPLLIQQLEGLDGLADRRFAKLEITADDERGIHIFSLQSVDFIAPNSDARASR